MSINIEDLRELYIDAENITSTARAYCEKHGLPYNDSFRRRVSKIINSDSNDDVVVQTSQKRYEAPTEKTDRTQVKNTSTFSAIGPDGKLMNIEQYCEYHNMDLEKVKSYKFISHTGTPYYNMDFYEQIIEAVVTEAELRTLIEEGLFGVKYEPIKKSIDSQKVGVVKIADLHLGAHIDNLIRTKDFSVGILVGMLQRAVENINDRGYAEVHVHILGDLIESFTGLSHKNTWKGLDKKIVGAEAVKLACKVLHEHFLSKIVNLGEVKIVAGNHDRVTSDNKEDVQGDAANLIGWGLELMGYSVEFNSLVITHQLGNITHVLTHGHHSISKRSTKQICWDYGVQGTYNLICEGHLHSIIEKLSVAQRSTFQTTRDDAVDHRRINCPSFFTGNFFSESLGYTSESGFMITEDNGNGVPNVFYYAV